MVPLRILKLVDIPYAEIQLNCEEASDWDRKDL